MYYHIVPLSEDKHQLVSFPGCVTDCTDALCRFIVPGWRLGWVTVHDSRGLLDEVPTTTTHTFTHTIPHHTIPHHTTHSSLIVGTVYRSKQTIKCFVSIDIFLLFVFLTIWSSILMVHDGIHIIVCTICQSNH